MSDPKKYDIPNFLGRVSYDGRYFWADHGGGPQMIGEMRGWGHIQYMFDTHEESANFQDALGHWIAQAINEKIERDGGPQENSLFPTK